MSDKKNALEWSDEYYANEVKTAAKEVFEKGKGKDEYSITMTIAFDKANMKKKTREEMVADITIETEAVSCYVRDITMAVYDLQVKEGRND